MKNFSRTMFTALLIAFMVFGLADVGYAQKRGSKPQKSLVTKAMARKVANRIQYDRRSTFGRSMFNSANDIRTIQESDKILYDIDNHLDCVENFIAIIFQNYGTGDGGYLAFSEFYFTPDEYEIAKKVYEGWKAVRLVEEQQREQERLAKEELQRRIQKANEQRLYDTWTTTGVPTLKYDSVSVKPIISATTISDFEDGLNNIDNMFFYDIHFLPTNQCQPKAVKKLVSFHIKVNADKSITLFDDIDSRLNYIWGNLGLKVVEPARYDFKELGKSVAVPCEMDIVLEFNAIPNKRNYYYVLAKYDKKSGDWFFPKGKYVSVISKDRYSELSLRSIINNDEDYNLRYYDGEFAEREALLLQSLIGLQPWAKSSKKCYVAFSSYAVSVKSRQVSELSKGLELGCYFGIRDNCEK